MLFVLHGPGTPGNGSWHFLATTRTTTTHPIFWPFLLITRSKYVKELNQSQSGAPFRVGTNKDADNKINKSILQGAGWPCKL